MASSDNRSRSWCFILYPDSAPADFDGILRNSCVAGCYSPLHTPDDAKPHYHVLLSFGSKKSLEQVIAYSSLLGGTLPFIVHDVRQMVRYFVHLDNPDKQQFDPSSISCFGGYDIDKFFTLSSASKQSCFVDIMSFVRDNPALMYCDLIDICLDLHPDWLALLQTNLACNKVITEYMHSRNRKIDNRLGSPNA